MKWLVMKYQTQMESMDGLQTITLAPGHGFVPVFDSYEEAEKHAKGKYHIVPIEILDNAKE